MLDRDDQVIELNGRIEDLQRENSDLRRKLAEAEDSLNQAPGPTPTTRREWIRGQLPGDVMIKTNTVTGKFVAIDKAEYDSLA